MCISSSTPADLRSPASALHGQTSRHAGGLQAPLHQRRYGIFQERSHGNVPPGGALPNRPLERQQGTDNRTGILGGKGSLPLTKNAAREAAGQPTKPTKFETDKAKLRRTIRQALSQAGSFDEFSSLCCGRCDRQGEPGRLSYLTPDRTKPITARKLGDDFDKAAVLALLTQNAHRAAEQTKAIPEYPAAVKSRYKGKSCKTTPADNTLQRREAKRAEGKGVGYDRWAAKHNLKQMAATVTAYQQYGFSSPRNWTKPVLPPMPPCRKALRG